MDFSTGNEGKSHSVSGLFNALRRKWEVEKAAINYPFKNCVCAAQGKMGNSHMTGLWAPLIFLNKVGLSVVLLMATFPVELVPE